MLDRDVREVPENWFPILAELERRAGNDQAGMTIMRRTGQAFRAAHSLKHASGIEDGGGVRHAFTNFRCW
jgi:hypothetical protein